MRENPSLWMGHREGLESAISLESRVGRRHLEQGDRTVAGVDVLVRLRVALIPEDAAHDRTEFAERAANAFQVSEVSPVARVHARDVTRIAAEEVRERQLVRVSRGARLGWMAADLRAYPELTLTRSCHDHAPRGGDLPAAQADQPLPDMREVVWGCAARFDVDSRCGGGTWVH